MSRPAVGCINGLDTAPASRTLASVSSRAPTTRTLLRFPGPLALLRVLSGEVPSLHHADAARVFLGDERLWDWPGVREFGALSVFDADRFGPAPHGVDGWYTCPVQALGPDDALYVPDAECASLVAGCRTARAARRRLPPDHGPRVERARAAMVAYDAVAAHVEAARTRGLTSGQPTALPPALRGLLNRPLHMLTPAERAALVEALV